jgi:hypothetical protein
VASHEVEVRDCDGPRCSVRGDADAVPTFVIISGGVTFEVELCAAKHAAAVANAITWGRPIRGREAFERWRETRPPRASRARAT